jgi:hypothetical protein
MSLALEHPTAAVLLIDANNTDRAFYADGLKRCASDYLSLEAGDGQTGRQICQIYGCVRVDVWCWNSYCLINQARAIATL